ncbi:hypothetical protein DM02DRAFT_527236 [Periconia macrospinosa]|uniref:EthD domain-containing protein n=1 Tax=Periconia macrospinosa TaxID=97972 RepID=A0A2V1DQA8_9PLEO|nr:hypothetical protein DM02DRAFT_527236 [Periconia macrospinosa]
MVFSFFLFVTRKPGLTPAAFKKYWDEKHVGLIKSIAGEHFPITHTRHYIARPAEENSTWPAAILIGSQEDFTYDGIAELVFQDEQAFQTFFAIVSTPEAAAQLAADEEIFIVREKTKAVVKGDTSITSRD